MGMLTEGGIVVDLLLFFYFFLLVWIQYGWVYIRYKNGNGVLLCVSLKIYENTVWPDE